MVVNVGETARVEPGIPPGFHMYDTPPLPVKVAEAPAQILVAVLVMLNVGKGLTVTLITAIFVQPETLAPVTV